MEEIECRGEQSSTAGSINVCVPPVLLSEVYSGFDTRFLRAISYRSPPVTSSRISFYCPIAFNSMPTEKKGNPIPQPHLRNQNTCNTHRHIRPRSPKMSNTDIPVSIDKPHRNPDPPHLVPTQPRSAGLLRQIRPPHPAHPRSHVTCSNSLHKSPTSSPPPPLSRASSARDTVFRARPGDLECSASASSR